MTSEHYSIRRTTEADWREVRELRLQMIRDTPDACAETLAEALAHDEAEWRLRGGRGSGVHGIQLAAVTGAGGWVGTMGGYVPDSATGPLLVGVFVVPEWRGTGAGLADALLESVEEWARAKDGRLTLHVHEDNARAISFYERHGYAATGHSVAYNVNPAKRELEMLKQL
ncbi:GNAT superfamily N-acetyltransferase [Arthrobacter stackebrandtii]|uniref:GNAT superfamily N-acetyltransferase n=1 Tax=Arthrobacter stackebrandtii TaxID=272161 RepID=A0ABS4Z0Z7_9MICC|nr:GNAT family N-acetyltransferase [Arthrobacter stackebrandtii]MBP2414664.1 GNAT superfamily N-acetyltransferase [Arthrobacter stackebrandtii]PYH01876.1 GNAT family N-acetyltransferase [Arthrobacter stackebrandtii]